MSYTDLDCIDNRCYGCDWFEKCLRYHVERDSITCKSFIKKLKEEHKNETNIKRTVN